MGAHNRDSRIAITQAGASPATAAFVIAYVPGGYLTLEERVQVARLLAAAPDLYQALKVLTTERNVRVYCLDRVRDAAKAAIAKAEGREP